MAKMDAFKGDNAKFLPKKTFKDRMSIGSGKDRIDLHYFGAGSHQRRCVRRAFPRCGSCTPATCSRGRTRRFTIGTTAGAASPTRRRSRRCWRASKGVDTVIPGHMPVTTWKRARGVSTLHQRPARRGSGRDSRRGRVSATRRRRSTLTPKYKGISSASRPPSSAIYAGAEAVIMKYRVLADTGVFVIWPAWAA